MKRPKVYVVGREHAYERMFMGNSWTVVDSPEEADAIQFTGGADVDPMLYGEPKHPTTGCDAMRDSREANLFNKFDGEKAMLGICRGSQFLCVMSGGRLWQNVNNHGVRDTHPCLDIDTQEIIQVSSTHHQMMDPSEVDTAQVLAVAGRTTYKEDGWGSSVKQDLNDDMRDIEAVFFPETHALCYQPHPEFFSPSHECQEFYFDLIKRHLKLEA